MNLFNLAIHVSLWILSLAISVGIAVALGVLLALNLATPFLVALGIIGLCLGEWVSGRFKKWSELLAQEFEQNDFNL